jgi:uncharacterized protein
MALAPDLDIAKKPADPLFALYLVAFAAAWTAYVLLIYPHVQALGQETLAYALVSTAVRVALWLAPVLLFLRFVDQVGPLRYLLLVEGWKRGALVGAAIVVLVVAGSIIRFGWPMPRWSDVTWNSILGTSLGVGVFEEVPFRGFILQKLAGRMNFWAANAVTALLFVGIHLPGWLSLHLFSAGLAANIFVISLLLGAILRCTRSLWACIIAHSGNDFVSFVLFHGR